jgi:RsiW-degrading membrane proteinase PrsW (M82 family)
MEDLTLIVQLITLVGLIYIFYRVRKEVTKPTLIAIRVVAIGVLVSFVLSILT